MNSSTFDKKGTDLFIEHGQAGFLADGDVRRHLGLADSEKKREESYAAWVKEAIAAGEWELIRPSLQRGQLAGGPS